MILRSFDFTGKRKYFWLFTALLVAASLVSIFTLGFNFGVDFTGGTELIFMSEKEFSIKDFRALIAPFEKSFESANIARLSQMGDQEANEYRYSTTTGVFFTTEQKVGLELNAKKSALKIESYNSVSGFAAEELRAKSWWIVIFVVAILLIYITFRFRFEYGVGAILSLIHDAIVTLGFYSFFQIPFDVSVIASVLTLLGYSINDTIVIYDRIRENMKLMRGKGNEEIINTSINQTLTRTLNTNLTTFIVVFILLIFGGISLKPFAFGLTIGIIAGTYSTLFIASPILVDLLRSRKKT